MSHETLVKLTKRTLAHAEADTIPLAADIVTVPATNYYDPQRWQLEMDRIFRRTPLVMAFTDELAEPHSFKAMEVAGTPVLITRSADGTARAFVNMCSHRGAVLVEAGTSGTARRITCPYHAWNYDSDGALVGVFDRQFFGDVDPAGMGLTPLPCEERAGIIFVGLTPNGSFDLDTHLCGYDAVLDHLGLADCHFVGSQSVEGPNWKVAYDGYLDFYHLPVLHKNTFGPDYCNRPIYDAWGPHQRVSSPDHRILALSGVDEANWTKENITQGVWTIFPHTSIAGFKVEVPEELQGTEGLEGGRMFMVSTLFPGDDPDTSLTYQNFLADFVPAPELKPSIEATMAFLLGVVRDEDYFTGNRIQRAVKTGAKTEFLFGRNEGGGQRFHGWVDRLVATDSDDEFLREFARAETVFAP
jgi:phenylpropionate dioxygenase-like ring-hydroxylating dioxygenase large terminal subunit